jgi:hypothetical protein
VRVHNLTDGEVEGILLARVDELAETCTPPPPVLLIKEFNFFKINGSKCLVSPRTFVDEDRAADFEKYPPPPCECGG